MLIPIKKNIFAWTTPDPEDNWIMRGHILDQDGDLVIFDPPLVPGLTEAIKSLGNPVAVILTTLDHTRGCRYITRNLDTKLLIPSQPVSEALDPEKMIVEKKLAGYETYEEGEIGGLDLTAFRVTVPPRSGKTVSYMDEMMLLDNRGNLFAGDIAMGTPEGKILTCPQGFMQDPPEDVYRSTFKAASSVIIRTGSTSLFAGHGDDLVGNLQETVRTAGK